jgi:hypothetical protein
MKVFASFFKKKRCLSFARGRPNSRAQAVLFLRKEPKKLFVVKAPVPIFIFP